MLMKIGDITSKLGVSHRTLHYWEDIGLINSSRAENDYRYYDEKNQQKIRQILVLRKLRLPLKQIIMVLESDDTLEIIDALQHNLNEVEDEITALSTIRSILDSFILKLNDNRMIDLKLSLFDDSTILEIVDSLTVSRPTLQEVKTNEELTKVDEKLSKLSDQDIRIVYLPPVAVASALGIGAEAEHESDVMMSKYIHDIDLFKIHPSVKFYGFNHPKFGPSGEFIQHQYEVWATIPNDLEVSTPLVKKHFDGGLYAAYTSKPVSFDDWMLFGEWLSNNEDFEYDGSRSYREDTSKDHKVRCSGWGCLEEHFNSYNLYDFNNKKHVLSHIDFLIPIKEKEVQ